MTPNALNLNDRTFAMISSTASDVDPLCPTVFRYHEQGGMIWGDYDGDTVRAGRFVGVRDREHVDISFAHVVETTDCVVRGSAESVIQIADDGALELIERFGTDNGEQSVCREQVRSAESRCRPSNRSAT